jgi:hypothetical protein
VAFRGFREHNISISTSHPILREEGDTPLFVKRKFADGVRQPQRRLGIGLALMHGSHKLVAQDGDGEGAWY